MLSLSTIRSDVSCRFVIDVSHQIGFGCGLSKSPKVSCPGRLVPRVVVGVECFKWCKVIRPLGALPSEGLKEFGDLVTSCNIGLLKKE